MFLNNKPASLSAITWKFCVAFEVDVLYLFPVALVFNEEVFGWRAFVEVCIFLLILSLAIVYAWRKGVIRWTR